jgi:hypothetical protein
MLDGPTLPTALQPLAENRRELFAALDLLDRTSDPMVRADLASELVGIGSRYEDVKGRVVYPALRATRLGDAGVERAETDQHSVRAALSDIRQRTRHIKPDYVHADDPDGFEAALGGLVEAIRSHVGHEDADLFPALDELDPPAAEQLRRRVAHAVEHASTHPNPPHNPIGRAVVAVGEKLEHDVKDESTQLHPGIDRLHRQLERQDAGTGATGSESAPGS